LRQEAVRGYGYGNYGNLRKNYEEVWGKEIRYIHMEAGYVAQNEYLQEALGLGTVSIEAFYDDIVRDILSLPKHYAPLYIVSIGYKR